MLVVMLGATTLLAMVVLVRLCARSELGQSVCRRCTLLRRVAGLHRRRQIVRAKAQRWRRREDLMCLEGAAGAGLAPVVPNAARLQREWAEVAAQQRVNRYSKVCA
jgi:hypothetical protein